MTFRDILAQCDEQGIKFEAANAEDDEEDWEDVQEEMEDFWMRSPKVKQASAVC